MVGESFILYRIGHWRVPPDSVQAYAFATCCVGVAALLRWGLGLVDQTILPFPTFFPAVFFAALVGGAGAGVFAAILGGIIGWWAFMPPYFVFTFQNAGQAISVLVYLGGALLIVWGADHYRRITKQLQKEETFRKLAVEELAHRLKNKIATIQSIISFQLRDSPQTRDVIIGRLSALSATDDLILETQGKGAYLQDILNVELRPYERSRILTEGPSILLPPKLALTMAMLVHELATNAAKYGALSSANGQVSIRWSRSDSGLNLEWRESGGPIITAPKSHGFGMLMLTRALEQFGGSVEMLFDPTGLICKLRATISGEVDWPSTRRSELR